MVIKDIEFDIEAENAEKIILSKTRNFEEEIVLNKGDKLELLPGIYFWKVKNFF
jgi:sporulation protein YlmC with PRC-barrel domain